MWRGVLVLALRDLSKKKHHRAAKAWLDSTSHELQSFEWLCDELGINADYFRRLIHEKDMSNTKITEKRSRRVGGAREKHDRGMPESVWSSLRGRRG